MAAVDRSLVANLAMFAGLASAEQHELLREARSVRYPKGTAVFDQGAEADRPRASAAENCAGRRPMRNGER
jgi:CRP/FNR family transcriptional regulator, nitrogen oxide reductase regulator